MVETKPGPTGNSVTRRRWLRLKRKPRPTAGAMSVMDHLRELRTRLILAALAFVVVSVIVFVFYEPLLAVLKRPLCALERTNPELLRPFGCDLAVNTVTGAFQFRVKLAALFGIAFSAPIWLYQIYAFVVPALTPKEKRYTVPFIAAASLLFLMGTAVAYFSLEPAVRFLIKIGGEGLVPVLGAGEYLNFVGLMLLGFGALFELPLILFFLGLVEVVTIEQLRSGRRTAIVTIVILAAVITPSQDPFTMLVLSIPLYASYEATIALLRLVARRRA